jgi:diketogulonate reductase-like aldo/keto reductase
VIIAWGLSQGPTVISIPSSRSPGHATDAAGAADLELTTEDLAELSSATFSRD